WKFLVSVLGRFEDPAGVARIPSELMGSAETDFLWAFLNLPNLLRSRGFQADIQSGDNRRRRRAGDQLQEGSPGNRANHEKLLPITSNEVRHTPLQLDLLN